VAPEDAALETYDQPYGRWHDGGTWRLAQLLDQYRGPDGWRCVVTYSTGPGMRYLRADPAEDLRRADDQHPRHDAR
jgi:hypothetical protein